MSRTFIIIAVVLAIVAVLTLVVTGTIYAFKGRRAGCGDSGWSQQYREDCTGYGRCGQSGNCAGASRCGVSSDS
jgi:hypothetical protein